MDIRPFQLLDEDAIIILWQKCSLLPWGNENESRAHIKEKANTQPDLFLVGVFDQQIIATAMADYLVDRKEGFLRYVAVAPKHRMHGHARRIISSLEELLQRRGCKSLRLEVSATRYPAIQCYCRIGYVAKAIIMQKYLPLPKSGE
jgi:ribosomal protein S18 acetylase RimI-like enzyme